jgi:hypothetical protein
LVYKSTLGEIANIIASAANAGRGFAGIEAVEKLLGGSFVGAAKHCNCDPSAQHHDI